MPKFFQINTSPYDFERDGYSQLSDIVYGPFTDDAHVREDLLKRHIDKDRKILVFEAELWNVPQNPKEKPEDQKRAPGNEANWRKVDKGGEFDHWECKDCGETIRDATIAHPIWDGPPGSHAGGGECEYEHVGYCPNCEKRPNFHGAPIERPAW